MYYVFQTFKRQSLVAYDLFLKLVQHADLNQERPHDLAVYLWGIMQKHGTFDTKLSVSLFLIITISVFCWKFYVFC